MEGYHRIGLNANKVVNYLFWAKYTLFFLSLTGSFTVLLVPQLLWSSHEPKSEPTSLYKGTNVSTWRQMRLPNHDPEDVLLVRDLSSKLMPPAKKGHVSAYDLPFTSKLVEELRALTDYKQGGYFVEVGSGDKDLFSDMLFLERHMGWTGLLVEPDLVRMKVFRRNAWIAPACMSLNNSAYEFHHQHYIRYHGHDPRSSSDSLARVICYPFHTFWLALNRPVIDYFSLDVGGGEVEILETIPYDKVDIKIVHVDYTKARDGFMGVTTLLQRNGYKVVPEVLPDYLFFIKKEYVNLYNEI